MTYKDGITILTLLGLLWGLTILFGIGVEMIVIILERLKGGSG
jgi:hypothetical protein